MWDKKQLADVVAWASDTTSALERVSDAQGELREWLQLVSEQVDRLDARLEALQRGLERLTGPDSTPGRYLTEGEAALHLGVSVRTVRNWRYENKGPAYTKLGGSGAVRYTREALDDYAQKA